MNNLTIDTLLQQATKEQIVKSTYLLAGNILVRLFNSKEYVATVPTLFPNLLQLKRQLYYSNVRGHRHDYIKGKMTGNRKTDLVIQNPIIELEQLGLTMEALNDNNTSKL